MKKSIIISGGSQGIGKALVKKFLENGFQVFTCGRNAEKLESLKNIATFGPWLKRIVINNSIYHYKKTIKNNEVPIDDILYKVENEEDGISSDYEFTNLKAQQVLNSMKTLKDNYRLALTLNLIEGYDIEEISKIMNISNANCRTTISRAKESLRKKLQVVNA